MVNLNLLKASFLAPFILPSTFWHSVIFEKLLIDQQMNFDALILMSVLLDVLSFSSFLTFVSMASVFLAPVTSELVILAVTFPAPVFLETLVLVTDVLALGIFL